MLKFVMLIVYLKTISKLFTAVGCVAASAKLVYRERLTSLLDESVRVPRLV